MTFGNSGSHWRGSVSDGNIVVDFGDGALVSVVVVVVDSLLVEINVPAKAVPYLFVVEVVFLALSDGL